jgi:hypothetical protein
MRDPAERAASLALRDGGPGPVRRAVDWHRSRDRLHTGDEIAMAHDALHAYRSCRRRRRQGVVRSRLCLSSWAAAWPGAAAEVRPRNAR